VNLTAGERVVRCLLGQPIDRLPFGVGLGWCPWGETMERWRAESNNPNLDVARELGYEPGFALPSLESGPFPHFVSEVLEKTGDTVVSRDWRGITMRTYRKTYPQLGIWGGLDKRVLALDFQAIDRELQKIPDMMKLGGRFLPQFDHLIPPDVPWGNFVYAANRVRELCHHNLSAS